MRVLLLVALSCLVACASAAVGVRREPLRPHGNPSLTHRAARPTPVLKATAPLTADKFSPFQAYHVEPTRPPRPLWEAHWDVEDFHTADATGTSPYDLELSGVIDNAKLYATMGTPGAKSAWVFDIDETSLSGYDDMLSIGFGYVPKLSHDWIMNATAPAIPQTLSLYNQLIKAGYRVVFLTGRPLAEHDATAANMAYAGYVGFDTIITRTPAEKNLSAAVYKANRRTQLVEEEGYEIVGCVGDQWSDLAGPYTGFKVKLPNYIYFLP